MNLTSINRLSAITQPPYVFAALLAPTSKPPALQLAPSTRAAPSSLDSLEVLTSMKKCLINSKESTNKALHKFTVPISVATQSWYRHHPAPGARQSQKEPHLQQTHEGTTSKSQFLRFHLEPFSLHANSFRCNLT